MARSTTTSVNFRHRFALTGLDRPAPPGTYRVDIEEEPIDGLSFLAYRRLATFIRIPLAGSNGTIQDLLVDPKELERALERDAASEEATAGERKSVS
jgi:hypothetical protein